jgi:5-methylcytosine-specific restriction endonuclease McrA
MPYIAPKSANMPVACIGRTNSLPCADGGIAVPGTSRCRNHGGKAWAGKPRNRQAEYNNREYKINRKAAIQREPVCHWGFPGCTGRSTQADHLIPVAEGGTGALENLVGACGRCNALRGASLGGTVTKARRQAKETSNVRPFKQRS